MAYNMLLFSITVLIYTLKWKENNLTFLIKWSEIITFGIGGLKV